ncbi:MAG: hypothetical protein WD749_13205 [Phycisphaerales bacterium]
MAATPRAHAQCNPALHEIGGEPGPVCTAAAGHQAVARGRFISIESTPTSGSPAVVARLALDDPAIHMQTEFYGRIWAIDALSLYAIDTSTPAAPQVISRYSLLPAWPQRFERLRVKPGFVYASTSDDRLLIFDTANPAAPVLRSSLQIASTDLRDLEIVGGYAYLSIHDFTPAAASVVVVDISNPAQPFEVRRVGNSARDGLRVTSRGATLYALAENESSGAIEAWSLANPAAPFLLSVNTTIGNNVASEDELRAVGNAAVSAVVYLQTRLSTLRLYHTSSLAPLSAVGFPYAVKGLGLDAPLTFRLDAYVTRSSGQLARVVISQPGAPVADQSYHDVPPGRTISVAARGDGFSALSAPLDLWVYAAPAGSAPPGLLAHLSPDPGFEWVPGTLIAVPGGGLLAVETTHGQNPTSWIICYNVVIGPTPGVHFAGAVQASGVITGIDAGIDASGTRRIYYVTSTPTGSTLRILNATNFGAMTIDGIMGISANAAGPLRFIPASAAAGTPPRLLIGGGEGVTQVISVAQVNPATHQGYITSSAQVIIPGTPPMVWLADGHRVRGYRMSPNSAPPTLESSFIIAPQFADYVADGVTSTGGLLHLLTTRGDLLRVETADPAAPRIAQIARISSDPFWSWGRGVAFDGANLHVAGGTDGYTVLPTVFPAPPREDPVAAGSLYGIRIVPVCPGGPSTLTAEFIADPPVSSYQWMKYNPATFLFAPLSDGPTGTGSSIAGATTANLTITGAGPADIGYYRCVATNACGTGGTWSVEARLGGYANCDNSTTAPALNVADFSCFLQRYAAGEEYANCDGSTTLPTLNVADFSCFLQRYADGCH